MSKDTSSFCLLADKYSVFIEVFLEILPYVYMKGHYLCAIINDMKDNERNKIQGRRIKSALSGFSSYAIPL